MSKVELIEKEDGNLYMEIYFDHGPSYSYRLYSNGYEDNQAKDNQAKIKQFNDYNDSLKQKYYEGK